jgi:hypothetical protein
MFPIARQWIVSYFGLVTNSLLIRVAKHFVITGAARRTACSKSSGSVRPVGL